MNTLGNLGRAAGIALTLLPAAPAMAATCGNDASGFERWLGEFRREAAGAGISASALRALDGVTYSTQVIGLDRNQKHFSVPFEQFVANRVTKGRIAKGKQMLKQYAGPLAGIEQRFGVPGPILVAIWGMETDFGANSGKMPVFRSLATLAYDCRRTEFFTGQLLDALRIVQRGDLSIGQMRGAWAGELGQTQFMPSSYVKYAVDFSGDGHADLISNPVDVLASTANYLKAYGWQRGGDYHQGGANFQALLGWNKAVNNARAIGLFADKLSQ
ncbi:lytic murein transglycosylase [Ancylobacter sp. G4_0304]|uniref:lytic murein transglycosylase n=1 Tax=Ancylobacter sp. G4_0304 TaxID=3114289 RepID=UPI0039C67727